MHFPNLNNIATGGVDSSFEESKNNVKFTTTGKPFFCETFDANVCPSCKPNVTRCVSESSSHHIDACYALWTQTKNGTQSLIRKGCWSFPRSTPMCSTLQDRCAVGESVSKSPLNLNDDLFFCCCRHSTCNARFEFDATVKTHDAHSQYLSDLPPSLANEVKDYRLRARPQKSSADRSFSDQLAQNLPYLLLGFLSIALLVLLIYFLFRLCRYWSSGTSQSNNNNADVEAKRNNNGDENLPSIFDIWSPKAWRGLLQRSAMGKRRGGKRDGAKKLYQSVAMNKIEIKLDEKDVIGGGTYGNVYRVPIQLLVSNFNDQNSSSGGQSFLTAANNTATEDGCVAVKVFKRDNTGKLDSSSWENEQDIYRISALVDCENVLRFYDARKNGPDSLWLITEYHANGSIYEFLKQNIITLPQLLHIATTTLAGVAFLHEEILSSDERRAKPTIIHRDLKSKNVLLKRDLTACIADFGLAVKCEHGCTPKDSHNQVGTRRYMSPEVLELATEQSAFAYKQIDVYATSLILWELISRCKLNETMTVADYRMPYQRELDEQASASNFLYFISKERKRPKFLSVYAKDAICGCLCTTVTEMWDQEPEARITARCALDRCRALQSTLALNDTSATSENVTSSAPNRSLPENPNEPSARLDESSGGHFHHPPCSGRSDEVPLLLNCRSERPVAC